MLGQAQSSQPAEQESSEELESSGELNAELERASIDAGAITSDKIGGMQLGLARWVQLGFAVLALVLFWALDKGIGAAWGAWGTPKPTLVTAIAAVIALVVALIAYKNKALGEYAFEVAGELAKVVWPSRDERWTATVVVIVASIIAAIVVGLLDASLKIATDWIFTR